VRNELRWLRHLVRLQEGVAADELIGADVVVRMMSWHLSLHPWPKVQVESNSTNELALDICAQKNSLVKLSSGWLQQHSHRVFTYQFHKRFRHPQPLSAEGHQREPGCRGERKREWVGT
jgi:hypothetical protein